MSIECALRLNKLILLINIFFVLVVNYFLKHWVTVNFLGQTGIHRNSTGILPKFYRNSTGIPVEIYVYIFYRNSELLKFRITAVQFTGIHRNSPEFTGIHRNSPEFTGIHRNSPEFTGIHRNSPEFTGIHRNSPEFTGIHRNSVFTGIHKFLFVLKNSPWGMNLFSDRTSGSNQNIECKL